VTILRVKTRKNKYRLKPVQTSAHRSITIDKIILENNFDSDRVMRSKTIKRDGRGDKSQVSQHSHGVSTSKKSEIENNPRNGYTIKQRKRGK